MARIWFSRILAAVALATQATFAGANTHAIPAPTGTPLLTVSGSIARTNDGAHAVFDRAMLEQLGTATIRTHTPWHKGEVAFEGVPLKRLMEHVGATGTELRAIALNDYSSTLPIEDLARFGVILAMKKDGQEMPVRDKGPLFIIYPYDSDSRLKSDDYYARSVWQVKELQVR